MGQKTNQKRSLSKFRQQDFSVLRKPFRCFRDFSYSNLLTQSAELSDDGKNVAVCHMTISRYQVPTPNATRRRAKNTARHANMLHTEMSRNVTRSFA